MDINMTPVDGFELTALIKDASPASAVIALSMHNMLVFAKKMFSLGARGYITKNASFEEVKECISEVVNGGKYICREIKDILAAAELGVGDPLSDINLLTKREIYITKMVMTGHSSKTIALQLELSVRTIEAHRTAILKKLNLKNTAELINYSFSRGL